MVIRDISKGTVLADRAWLAITFLSRLVGLLGRATLNRGEGLVIIPCASVHTIGMRFPIDAVFFGKDKKVVATASGLVPYRISKYYPRAQGVLELPSGTLERMPVDVGDQLELS